MTKVTIPYDEILNQTKVAIGLMDSEFVYRYCNQTMASILGLPVDRILGRTQDEVLREARRLNVGVKIDISDIEEALVQLHSIQEKEKIREFITDTLDGRFFNMHRMTLDGGEHVVFGSDITELVIAKRELVSKNEELKFLSSTDELTQINNYRASIEAISSEFARVKRNKSPFSLIILDIDHFKLVNDTYGHAPGGEVIKMVAGILNNEIRDYDFCGRIGGEEFIVGLPSTSIDCASEVAERIRISIANSSTLKTNIKVTSSFGVAEVLATDESIDVSLGKADKALYQAKEAGRNKVKEFDD